jgi:predicted RNase H-like nuclease
MKGFVGIDGCRAGWFTVSLFNDQSWKFEVFSNVEEIWRSLSHSDILLIDIPIGLRDAGSEERKCDIEARQLLGQPRSSSVFPPPTRPALDWETREEASEVNHALTGRKIGVQTWGIVPKIREVDQFLRTTAEAREKIREIHPEVLFWALNESKAMPYNKKRREGFAERLQVLRRHFPQSDELVIEALTKLHRNQVAGDDILDALAAAITGKCSHNHLATIPGAPERDSEGLPMEMVYYTQD